MRPSCSDAAKASSQLTNLDRGISSFSTLFQHAGSPAGDITSEHTARTGGRCAELGDRPHQSRCDKTMDKRPPVDSSNPGFV